MKHIPVLMNQVMEGLQVRPSGCYWDGTFGNGGHSSAILECLDRSGRLYASDRDGLARDYAAQRFGSDSRFEFIFASLEEAVHRVPGALSGWLWDLGVSTDQLVTPERGFSFRQDGPLDMRMDAGQLRSAANLVNELPEKELADLIYHYGEERFSRRIAAQIVTRRKHARIETTAELAEICRFVYPRKRHRIDPATRTFQALRIAVNDELGQLERTLPVALEKLAPGGRAVVISFHSLEDRIVKHCFRGLGREGGFRVVTKRPLVASEAECAANPAARSAKLRVIEREEAA